MSHVCDWMTVVNLNIDPLYSGSQEEEKCRGSERGWGGTQGY